MCSTAVLNFGIVISTAQPYQRSWYGGAVPQHLQQPFAQVSVAFSLYLLVITVLTFPRSIDGPSLASQSTVQDYSWRDKNDNRHYRISPEIPAWLGVGRWMIFLGGYAFCLFQRHRTSASSCDLRGALTKSSAIVRFHCVRVVVSSDHWSVLLWQLWLQLSRSVLSSCAPAAHHTSHRTTPCFTMLCTTLE